MRLVFGLILGFASAAQAAERPVSPAEFEALVTGQTLGYSTLSGPHGAEEYLPDRRVRWSFLDGDCLDGEWYASGGQICFVYDGITAPQCWQFYLNGDRLTARFENDPSATQLFETSRLEEPLYCLGPEVGV